MLQEQIDTIFNNLDLLNSSMKYDKAIKNIYNDNDVTKLVYEKKVKDNTVKMTIAKRSDEGRVVISFDFDIDNYNSTCVYDPSSEFCEWECSDSMYTGQLKPVFEATVKKLANLIDDADYISRVFSDVVDDLESGLK